MDFKTHLRRSVCSSILRQKVSLIGWMILFLISCSSQEIHQSGAIIGEQDYLQFEENIRLLLADHPHSLDETTIDDVFQEYLRIRRIASMFEMSFSEIRYLQAFALKSNANELYLFDFLFVVLSDLQKGDRSILSKRGFSVRHWALLGIIRPLSLFLQVLDMMRKEEDVQNNEIVKNLIKDFPEYRNLGEEDYPDIRALVIEGKFWGPTFNAAWDLLEISQTRETFSDQNLVRLDSMALQPKIKHSKSSFFFGGGSFGQKNPS